MCIEYHCEGLTIGGMGWLPVKGTEDAELVTREMAIDAGDRALEGQVCIKLLVPTEYTLCPCEPEYSFNEDLNEVNV